MLAQAALLAGAVLLAGTVGIVLYKIHSRARTLETSNNYIFAIDLHGVLFKFDYKELFKSLIKIKDKFTLARILLYPPFAISAIKLLFKKTTPEQFIELLTKREPKLANYHDSFVHFLNSQKPIPKTVEILKQLKENGHKLSVLSNIGEKSYAALKEKFPEIFDCFDEEHICISSNGYLSKPHQEAFTNYLDRFGLEANNVIFIDNKQSNVSSARSVGMQAIRYKSSKQLLKKLQEMSILP